MGQAKRRGTREERIEQALERDAAYYREQAERLRREDAERGALIQSRVSRADRRSPMAMLGMAAMVALAIDRPSWRGRSR